MKLQEISFDTLWGEIQNCTDTFEVVWQFLKSINTPLLQYMALSCIYYVDTLDTIMSSRCPQESLTIASLLTVNKRKQIAAHRGTNKQQRSHTKRHNNHHECIRSTYIKMNKPQKHQVEGKKTNFKGVYIIYRKTYKQ